MGEKSDGPNPRGWFRRAGTKSEQVDADVQDKLTAVDAQFKTLTERMDLNSQQIDTLQVESVKKRRWFLDPSILISIIALLVSIVSPIVAQQNLTSDRERQDQTRLVELIRQVPGLRQRPESVDELLLVADEATQLMARMPSTPDQKMEVALALDNAGDLTKAKELYQSASQQAQVPLQKANTLHSLARIEFELQDYTAGRADYERAIQLSSHLAGNLKLTFPGQDHIRWGSDELFFAGNCDGAKQQAQQAEDLMKQLQKPSYGRTTLGNDIEKFRADIAKNCR